MSREKDVEEAKVALLNTFCSSSRPDWLPGTSDDRESMRSSLNFFQRNDGSRWNQDVLYQALEELRERRTIRCFAGAWRISVDLCDGEVICPICASDMQGHVVKNYSGVTLDVESDGEIVWDVDADGFDVVGVLTNLSCPDCGVEFYAGSVNYVRE